MGGLVARERFRLDNARGATSDIGALITLGTPHQGAEIIKTISDRNRVNNMFYNWESALTVGLLREGTLIQSTHKNIIYKGPVNSTRQTLEKMYPDAPYSKDMYPGSSFLNTLNSNTSNSLPVAHYTIYGDEDWNVHFRLGDAAENKSDLQTLHLETGQGINENMSWQSWYLSKANLNYSLANFYISQRKWWNYVQYSSAAAYLRWVGDGFMHGFNSLNHGQQNDWDRIMVGSNGQADDGVVPMSSQAPGFVSLLRRRRAGGANHLELYNHENARDQVRWACMQGDVNLRRR